MTLNCAICSDLIDESGGSENISATPCGHIFHHACIRRWVGQSATCPECRQKILRTRLIPLYFNYQPSQGDEMNLAKNKLSEMQAKIIEKEEEIQKEKENLRVLTLQYKEAENSATEYKNNLQAAEFREQTLKRQLKEKNQQVKILKTNEKKVEELEEKVKSFKRLETIVVESEREFESFLQAYDTGSGDVKQLVACCSILKREVKRANDTKKELKTMVMTLRKEIEGNSSKMCQCMQKKEKLEALVMKLQAEKEVLRKKITAALVRDSVTPLDLSSLDAMKENSHVPEEALSKTPAVNPIVCGPSKKFKVNIASFEKNLKLCDLNIQNNNNNCKASVSGLPLKMHESRPIDKDSVINTGYNGLGGHSNFIKRSSTIKRSNPSKKIKRAK